MEQKTHFYEIEQTKVATLLSQLPIGGIGILSVGLARIQIGSEPLWLFLPAITLGFYLGTPYLLISILGAILGLLSLSFSFYTVGVLGVFLLFAFLLLSRFLPLSFQERLVVSLGVSDALMRIIYRLGNHLPFTFTSLLYGGSVALLGWYGMQIITHLRHKEPVISPWLLYAVALFAPLFSFALPPLRGAFSIQHLFLCLTLLVLSFVGGIGVTSVGTMISLFLVILTSPNIPPIPVIMIHLIFPLVSLFHMKGKMIQLFAYLVAWASFLGLYRENPSLLWWGYEAVISGIVFLAIPTPWLRALRRRIPAAFEVFELQETNLRRLRNDISNRMGKVVEAYHSVGQQLMRDTEEEGIPAALVEIEQSLCLFCPKRIECLKGNNRMLPLMKKLLLEDVGADDWRAIEQECLKPNQFRSLILQERDLFAVKNKYASQYKTLKQLMLVNLSGIQEVVATVKQQVDYESSTFVSSEEGRIKEWMEQHHFETVYIRYRASELEKTRLEVGIIKVPMTLIKEEIVPGLETLLDTAFIIDSITPIPYEPYWRLVLTSVHHVQVMYGVGQLSKEETCCGDSYLHFKRNNDVYFAISDGMGTGERAKQESQLTLSLFQTMLESGMKPGKAIQSVNSLLRIKNRKDSYATLDVVSVNTKTGKGCFIKTGAPPSLLIRRNECIVIDHNALPIGIVDDIEAYDYVIDLEPGDNLLLFSDGFSENRQRQAIEMLPNLAGTLPQQKVKEILALYQEEELEDDLTIFLLEITK